MHLNSLCVSIKDLRQLFYTEIIQQDVPEKRKLGHPVEIEISGMERLAQTKTKYECLIQSQPKSVTTNCLLSRCYTFWPA